MTTFARSYRLALSLSIASGLCCAALAFQPEKDPPVLGGPKVKDLNTPGAGRTFDGKAGDMKKAVPELPQVRYMQILRETLGDSAPKAIQLTAEQQEKIRDADRTFHDSQRKFLGDNSKDVEKLRKEAAAKHAAKGGDKKAKTVEAPDQMQPADPPAKGAALEKAKQMRANAPRATEVQAKIWSILTAEQQAALKPKLDSALDQMIHDRAAKEAEKTTQRKLKDQAAKEAAGQTPALKGQRANRVIEKFENATPEEQAQMKAKFKERFNQLPEEQKAVIRAKLKEKGIDPDKLENSDK